MVKRRQVDSGIRVVSTSTGGAQLTTSATITAPTGRVVGNLLYAFVVCDDTNGTLPGSMKGDSGAWTYHTGNQFTTHNNYGYILGFYKWITSSEPASYVFSGTTVDALCVGIVQLSGVNATTPFGTPVARTGANSATASFSAVSVNDRSAVLIGAGQAGNFSNSVSNSITWGPGFSSAFASTSQYNKGTSQDAEVVMAAINTGLGQCSFTPGNATWNTAYYTGTITVPLNHA